MKRIAVILVLFAVAALAADKKDTLEELKAKAESSEGKHKIELLVEIAERQLKVVDDSYSSGNPDQGLAALKDVIDYGIRAAKEATASGKRMKHTEIDLRKIADKLDNIGKSVDFESRPPIVDGLKKLEAARNDLLFRMFK